jgi:hypothetical protein
MESSIGMLCSLLEDNKTIMTYALLFTVVVRQRYSDCMIATCVGLARTIYL